MKKLFTFLITVLSVNLYGQIPTTGLTGCYLFKGNTNDNSGNANHATNFGAVLTNDRFGNPSSAYFFDGISAHMTVPNIAATGNAARSICAWVSFAGTIFHGVVATGAPADAEAFNLVVNYFGCNVGVMGYNDDFYPLSGTAVNNSVWHLLIATYDGAGNLKIFVDANLDNSGSLSYNTTGQNNYIGCSNHFPNDVCYFHGVIDDVFFYDHALSLSEIDSVYNNTITGTGLSASDTFLCENFCIDFHDQSIDNPVSWQWNFEGGTPASSTDQNPTNICYNDSGVFDVSLITIDGNGNTDTLLLSDLITVHGNPFAPVITQLGNFLACSNASSYQWYLNEVIIPGATYQVYTITESGLYTVVITNENGCQAQADYNATLIGIDEVETNDISIFPNPAFDQLKISSNGNSISQIMITDLLGETLLRFSFPPSQKEIILSLADLSSGIYLLQLISDDGTAVKKIVKE